MEGVACLGSGVDVLLCLLGLNGGIGGRLIGPARIFEGVFGVVGACRAGDDGLFGVDTFSDAISAAIDCCKNSSNSNDRGLLTFLGDGKCGLVGLLCPCCGVLVGDAGGWAVFTGEGGRGTLAAAVGERGGARAGPPDRLVGDGGIGMGAFASLTV